MTEGDAYIPHIEAAVEFSSASNEGSTEDKSESKGMLVHTTGNDILTECHATARGEQSSSAEGLCTCKTTQHFMEKYSSW